LHANAVWSFLLFSGYLTAVKTYLMNDALWATLAVPNREVMLELTKMARSWMEDRAGGSEEGLRWLNALFRGAARTAERILSRIVMVSLSYFDTGGPEPERVYHGFVVGLLASIGPDYDVRSNRESGFGRCDVMVLPKTAGRPGIVLELKTVDVELGETPDAA